MLATALMTTALLPVVGAGAPAPDCAPSSAPAKELGTDPVTYERAYSSFGKTYVQLWQESNGVPGLQPDSTWNCGHAADTLLESACYGCALML